MHPSHLSMENLPAGADAALTTLLSKLLQKLHVCVGTGAVHLTGNNNLLSKLHGPVPHKVFEFWCLMAQNQLSTQQGELHLLVDMLLHVSKGSKHSAPFLPSRFSWKSQGSQVCHCRLCCQQNKQKQTGVMVGVWSTPTFQTCVRVLDWCSGQ